jgi:hypothetical protein
MLKLEVREELYLESRSRWQDRCEEEAQPTPNNSIAMLILTGDQAQLATWAMCSIFDRVWFELHDVEDLTLAKLCAGETSVLEILKLLEWERLMGAA